MGIDTAQTGGVAVVTCSGPMTVPDGKTRLLEALNGRLDRGETKFVLDLRDVPYIDSPTIGAMMSCFKRAIDGGGGVKLALGSTGKVRDILHLTGLDGIVEIFDDPDAAVSSFGVADP